uniref:Uncharacterized protein n=1 Tax=Arundo donax TaxID=35708 RepID=A0A0A9ECB5_ARUDO
MLERYQDRIFSLLMFSFLQCVRETSACLVQGLVLEL